MMNKIFADGSWDVNIADKLNERHCLGTGCGRPCNTGILFVNGTISGVWHFGCWVADVAHYTGNAVYRPTIELLYKFLKENPEVALED